MTLNKTASLILIVAAAATFLYVAKPLLVPFVIALLIWYLINALSHWIGQFAFVRKFLPVWTHVLISSLVIFLILLTLGGLIVENARTMVNAGPVYQKNLGDVIKRLDDAIQIDLSAVRSAVDSNLFVEFGKLIETTDLTIAGIVQRILNTLSGIAANAFLILIYLIFLFFEQVHFSKKARALFASEQRQTKFFEIIDHINKAIRAYFKVKITVSLITATASYLLMVAVGLEFAIFWAFLIFLLNFIPNIGSLIATLFPTALALIQFPESFYPFLVILFGVGAIQVIVGNLVEPRMMGSSLNISSLVVILSLSLWGTMWGITGMILCVPITVIIMIVFAQFPSTRPVAILLSENGELMTNLKVIHEAYDEVEPKENSDP
ncbi:MAG: AI-2E family transporter [Acidobacteriota bacterium]|nr:AI-2E family transporter [Acidobacteriota bacterium]MDH3528232.1 AI-2E family transporter [Acidobacteriota bacterium]